MIFWLINDDGGNLIFESGCGLIAERLVYCTKCGAPLKDDVVFCLNCGVRIVKITSNEFTVQSRDLVRRCYRVVS